MIVIDKLNITLYKGLPDFFIYNLHAFSPSEFVHIINRTQLKTNRIK